MEKTPTKFAVFDIDGTVIRWQLYHAIVSELADRGHLFEGASIAINDARMTWKKRAHKGSYSDYEHKLIDIYNEALSRVKVSDFQEAVDAVFEEHKDQVYTYTRDLIRELKAQEYMLLTISGSQQEIIDKLAAYYGFDDAVGNIYEQKNGYFTGKSMGVIGKKGEVLQQLIAKHNLSTAGSIAVGDSGGDIDMFNIVEQPIAFNPDTVLYEEAKKQNWKIVLERKSVVYQLNPVDGKYLLDQTLE